MNINNYIQNLKNNDNVAAQMICNHNNPGEYTVATPTKCTVGGCNTYYNTSGLSDMCNANNDDWTCCSIPEQQQMDALCEGKGKAFPVPKYRSDKDATPFMNAFHWNSLHTPYWYWHKHISGKSGHPNQYMVCDDSATMDEQKLNGSLCDSSPLTDYNFRYDTKCIDNSRISNTDKWMCCNPHSKLDDPLGESVTPIAEKDKLYTNFNKYFTIIGDAGIAGKKSELETSLYDSTKSSITNSFFSKSDSNDILDSDLVDTVL